MAAFVIVCGPPASGKSRLAAHLGRELALPVISKDLIKERLMDHLGGGPPVGEASFEVQFAVARELLDSGTPFILEGAFFRTQTAIRDLAGLGEAVVVQVDCDLNTLERRYAEREREGRRHPGHRGLGALPDLRRRIALGEYGVPDLGRPILRVDTTDGATPPEPQVVAWVRDNMGSGIAD